jgi:hypothetical protein
MPAASAAADLAGVLLQPRQQLGQQTQKQQVCRQDHIGHSSICSARKAAAPDAEDTHAIPAGAPKVTEVLAAIEDVWPLDSAALAAAAAAAAAGGGSFTEQRVVSAVRDQLLRVVAQTLADCPAYSSRVSKLTMCIQQHKDLLPWQPTDARYRRPDSAYLNFMHCVEPRLRLAEVLKQHPAFKVAKTEVKSDDQVQLQVQWLVQEHQQLMV